jgi:hypothetical protein
MKSQKVMKTKLTRITAFLTIEITSGKCNQDDLDHILAHLRYNLRPYSAKDEAAALREEIVGAGV